ncbi:hypothetical protein TNCV_4507441 [Trichonephila clavipes]|nr:hypothetical protein TNCV_4507441 [Trichonephila clavipes]
MWSLVAQGPSSVVVNKCSYETTFFFSHDVSSPDNRYTISLGNLRKVLWASGFLGTLNPVSDSLLDEMAYSWIFMLEVYFMAIGRTAAGQLVGLRGLELGFCDRFNSCQVIYSQFGLVIHQNDHQARRGFVEWAQNEIAVVPDSHKRILFSDEAHFWLNGYVNKQNCRIWSEANTEVYFAD